MPGEVTVNRHNSPRNAGLKMSARLRMERDFGVQPALGKRHAKAAMKENEGSQHALPETATRQTVAQLGRQQPEPLPEQQEGYTQARRHGPSAYVDGRLGGAIAVVEKHPPDHEVAKQLTGERHHATVGDHGHASVAASTADGRILPEMVTRLEQRKRTPPSADLGSAGRKHEDGIAGLPGSHHHLAPEEVHGAHGPHHPLTVVEADPTHGSGAEKAALPPVGQPLGPGERRLDFPGVGRGGRRIFAHAHEGDRR